MTIYFLPDYKYTEYSSEYNRRLCVSWKYLGLYSHRIKERYGYRTPANSIQLKLQEVE